MQLNFIVRIFDMPLTPAQIQELADRFCSILMSHACHGLATSSLDGMGEITFRDGLIVAAAASGSKIRQAWIFEREDLPSGWSDAAVDLTIIRPSDADSPKVVGAVELKWWRQEDSGNASNRRCELVKDFIRAAANYKNVEDFSFVALLSTEVSWKTTTSTNGSDKDAMTLLTASGTQKWNLKALSECASVKSSVRSLGHRVPVPSAFHTKLLAAHELSFVSGRTASARVWSVVKPQKTVFLSLKELESRFNIKARSSAEGNDTVGVQEGERGS